MMFVHLGQPVMHLKSGNKYYLSHKVRWLTAKFGQGEIRLSNAKGFVIKLESFNFKCKLKRRIILQKQQFHTKQFFRYEKERYENVERKIIGSQINLRSPRLMKRNSTHLDS